MIGEQLILKDFAQLSFENQLLIHSQICILGGNPDKLLSIFRVVKNQRIRIIKSAQEWAKIIKEGKLNDVSN